MSECEYLQACPFFNDKMKDQPAMTQIYKKKYCLSSEKNNCARYTVRGVLGKEKVPIDLYPNQINRANQLISQG
jgi:hypothetical protein